MKRTSEEIEDDVYNLIVDSELNTLVNGKVFKSGDRPHNSKKEDIVVEHFIGRENETHQYGTVLIYLYVSDIAIDNTGVLRKNRKRTKEIQKAAQIWVNSLDTADTPYTFSTDETIKTIKSEKINQHFVSIRLRYELINH